MTVQVSDQRLRSPLVSQQGVVTMQVSDQRLRSPLVSQRGRYIETKRMLVDSLDCMFVFS